VIRKLGSKKQHKHLLVNRPNKDLRKAKQFIIVKETPSEDKDKDKDKKRSTSTLIRAGTRAASLQGTVR
jgi:hypothetical protein